MALLQAGEYENISRMEQDNTGWHHSFKKCGQSINSLMVQLFKKM